MTAKGLEIKPVATSTVQLPVTVKFDDLRRLSGDLWNQDRFAYQLDTEFDVDLPLIGSYTIPVTRSGELPVPRLPQVKITGLKINHLSYSAAELVAQVEVHNPNVFELAFSDFDYRLYVNQREWGKGSIDQRIAIPQKGAGSLGIPVRLNIMEMGQTAYQLLSSSQSLQYNLQGSLVLDTGMALLNNYRMPLNIEGIASLK